MGGELVARTRMILEGLGFERSITSVLPANACALT